MHYPKQWGLLQIVLGGFFAVGVFLFFWSLWSLKAKRDFEILEDEEGRRYRHYRRRRRFRWDRLTSGTIMAVIAFVLIGVTGAIQEYLGLTGKILVAHVRATPVKNSANGIPMMSVDLTLYDDSGNKVSDDIYLVNGDEVFIGGDIIAMQSWLNIVGIHSGYKLTKLEGMYSDVNLERSQPHTVQVLNGGDDDFFNTAYHKGWNSILVTAAYKNGSSVPTNGIGYNICVSQDAIVPQPDNQPC